MDAVIFFPQQTPVGISGEVMFPDLRAMWVVEGPEGSKVEEVKEMLLNNVPRNHPKYAEFREQLQDATVWTMQGEQVQTGPVPPYFYMRSSSSTISRDWKMIGVAAAGADCMSAWYDWVPDEGLHRKLGLTLNFRIITPHNAHHPLHSFVRNLFGR